MIGLRDLEIAWENAELAEYNEMLERKDREEEQEKD